MQTKTQFPPESATNIVVHTQGPWHVVHNSWDRSTVYGKNNAVIAQIPIGDLTCDEDQESFERIKEANAHLIAAAPELLEALKELADAGGEAWSEDRPCVRDARISIAKAEGVLV